MRIIGMIGLVGMVVFLSRCGGELVVEEDRFVMDASGIERILFKEQALDADHKPGATGFEVRTLLDSNMAAIAYRSYGIVVDRQSNLYITDTLNHRIYKRQPTGEVTLFAGSSQGYRDGVGQAAQFHEPHGIAIDGSGNVYVTDTNNHRIRKIDPSGKVTTIAGNGRPGDADGPGAQAQFNQPQGIAVDAKGRVYVADTLNHKIRQIDLAGQVTTIAGSTRGYQDGTGAMAQFNFVFGIAVGEGGLIYVADAYNHRIRQIDPSGKVTTIAGNGQPGHVDGQGTTAQLNQPHGIALDQSGQLYIADMQNHRIRKLGMAGQVTTIAGSTEGLTDGVGQAAQFNKPYALVFVAPGNLFIADTYNYRVRLLTLRR